MIAQELEVSLHMAFMDARQKRHELITVEHLLMAMLDNPSASDVLKSCGANIDKLRADLTDHIEEHTPVVDGKDDVDTQPTLGFQRVIQRAMLHVQSSGKKEVTGANVLVAIFGEKDSHAVYFLHQEGIARLDIVNFIAHGISKVSETNDNENQVNDNESQVKSNKGLETYTVNLNKLVTQGKIDPLIGRGDEVERLVQILCEVLAQPRLQDHISRSLNLDQSPLSFLKLRLSQHLNSEKRLLAFLRYLATMLMY